MRSTTSSYCLLKGKNLPWSAVARRIVKKETPRKRTEAIGLAETVIVTILKNKPSTKQELWDKSGIPRVDIDIALSALKRERRIIHTPREKKTEEDRLLGCLSNCRPGFYSLNTDRKP